MKQETLLFILLMLSVACKTAQVLPSPSSDKHYAQLGENLFISKYETTNAEYRLFLEDLSRTDPKAWMDQLPDTAGWNNFGLGAFTEYYHKHPAYGMYPVVTLSYENANRYSEWLTANYNKNPNRKFRKVVFRLPTETEWMQAAKGGHQNYIFPWAGPWMRNSKGNYLANFTRANDADIMCDSISRNLVIGALQSRNIAGSLRDNQMLTAAVMVFEPNDLGLYCMAGNVAEMIAEKGITKGGSFNDPGYYCRIASRQFYSAPSPTIGFRVVMQVIEK